MAEEVEGYIDPRTGQFVRTGNSANARPGGAILPSGGTGGTVPGPTQPTQNAGAGMPINVPDPNVAGQKNPIVTPGGPGTTPDNSGYNTSVAHPAPYRGSGAGRVLPVVPASPGGMVQDPQLAPDYTGYVSDPFSYGGYGGEYVNGHFVMGSGGANRGAARAQAIGDEMYRQETYRGKTPEQQAALDFQYGAAAGNAPSAAEIAGNQALQTSLQNQVAAAGSVRGGPMATAAAQRNNSLRAAGQQAQGVAGIQAGRASEMAEARNAYASTAAQQSMQQQQAEMEQRKLRQQGKQWGEGQATGIYNSQMQAEIARNAAARSIWSQNEGFKMASADAEARAAGARLNAAAGAAGGVLNYMGSNQTGGSGWDDDDDFSDERAKDPIDPLYERSGVTAYEAEHGQGAPTWGGASEASEDDETLRLARQEYAAGKDARTVKENEQGGAAAQALQGGQPAPWLSRYMGTQERPAPAVRPTSNAPDYHQVPGGPGGRQRKGGNKDAQIGNALLALGAGIGTYGLLGAIGPKPYHYTPNMASGMEMKQPYAQNIMGSDDRMKLASAERDAYAMGRFDHATGQDWQYGASPKTLRGLLPPEVLPPETKTEEASRLEEESAGRAVGRAASATARAAKVTPVQSTAPPGALRRVDDGEPSELRRGPAGRKRFEAYGPGWVQSVPEPIERSTIISGYGTSEPLVVVGEGARGETVPKRGATLPKEAVGGKTSTGTSLAQQSGKAIQALDRGEYSDEETKKGFKTAPDHALDQAARSMKGYAYSYKDQFTPPEQSHGEFNYGPMAQAMEKSAIAGTAVKKDESGMRMLDMPKLMKVQSALIAHQQEEIDHLKKAYRYGG